jgi:hypothetical protein
MAMVSAAIVGRLGWLRCVVALAVAMSASMMSGCSTVGVALSAVGVASDSGVSWEIVKHLHSKMTEGDDVPCALLNSVQRAVSARCGAFVPGSLLASDIQNSQLQSCPLAVVVGNPKLWPALPEMLDKGAQPESCPQSPLVALAQAQACPDFASASPEVVRSMQWLAQVDSRAIHHDVVRMLSCPSARTAGLDAVLGTWLAQGDLDTGKIAFGPLGALHPDYLNTPFARALEAQGHSAREGLGAYAGTQTPGFEEALRTSNWTALDWWFNRAPELANRVPPTQGNQLPWIPLARVLAPTFLTHADGQSEMVEYLMSRGANPWQRLPFDAGNSVVSYARNLKSPLVALLDPPPSRSIGATVVATTALPAAQQSRR